MDNQRSSTPLGQRRGGERIARLALVITAAVVMTESARPILAAGAAGNGPPDAALTATVDGLKKNSACPKDPKAVEQAAANLSVILNPGLVQREARKNTAFIQAEAVASATFSNPGALHAKKMEDPNFRAKYQAAMEAFKRQAKQTDLPIRPSATNAKQIEALRNDPSFRREREESMRAQMPPFPVPTNGLGILRR